MSRLIPKIARMLPLSTRCWTKNFGGTLDRANCIRAFGAHIEAVHGSVPAEHLRVFQIIEDWDPLCKFLGCEVPEGVSFPHFNEGDQTLKSVIRQIFVGPWVRCIALTAIGLAFLVWRFL
jgi:Sulfotransferase domain